MIWDLYIDPSDRPTLMLVTFSLGSWQSGTELFRLGTELAVHRRHHLTVITPGENLPETLEILRALGPHFDQWFIVGNPPFLKRMFEEGPDIDWTGRHVIIGTGAEATTEACCEWVCARLGVDPDREPIRVVNCYGSSDFGLDTATETLLSVAIKRRALRDPSLAETLFKAPFLWTDGRSDGTVSIGGANVFPGNIETAILENPELAAAVQHFQLAVEEDENCNKELVVYIGLHSGIDESARQAITRIAEEAILNGLLRDNREYEVTYLGNPTVRLRVVAVPAEETLDRATIKRRYIRKS